MKVPTSTPVELAKLACSFATHLGPFTQLFDRIAGEAVTRIEDFSPQDLTMIAQAMAKASHH